MGLVMPFSKDGGFIIGRRYYARFSDFEPNTCVTLNIEKRDYSIPGKEKRWTSEEFAATLFYDGEVGPDTNPFFEHDLESIMLCGFKKSFERGDEFKLKFEAARSVPISRLDWTSVEEPWRPALDCDGVSEKDFHDAKEVSLQTLCGGENLIYACCYNIPTNTTVMYLGIMDKGYKLIAVAVNGKLAEPGRNQSRLPYLDYINSARDSITALAKQESVLQGFRNICTQRTLVTKDFFDTLAKIYSKRRMFAAGDIETKHLDLLCEEH